MCFGDSVHAETKLPVVCQGAQITWRDCNLSTNEWLLHHSDFFLGGGRDCELRLYLELMKRLEAQPREVRLCSHVSG